MTQLPADKRKPEVSTVAIIDTVAGVQNIDPAIASFDMQMLIGTRGRERTESEWRGMLQSSGFRLREIVDLQTFASLLVVDVGKIGAP